MLAITSQEIAQFRSELADLPEALRALDAIEDCEGDVEDAAISLALHIGQEPNTSENWLEGLAKRCRVAVCDPELREELLEGRLKMTVEALARKKVCPEILATPVAIYAVKMGINDFCAPLEAKL